MQRKISKCNTVETKPLVGRIRQGPLLLHLDPSHTTVQCSVAAVALISTKTHNSTNTDANKNTRYANTLIHHTEQCNAVWLQLHTNTKLRTHRQSRTHIQPHTNALLHNVIWKGSVPVLEWWFAQFWKHSFTLPLFVSKGMKLRHMFGQPLTGDLVRFLSFIMILKISMVFLKVLWWESHN